MNMEEAKTQALNFRNLYAAGEITRGEAEKGITPHKNFFNERSAEIAKKYNQKPQRFRMGDFLRYQF